jgi:hypothetical protein
MYTRKMKRLIYLIITNLNARKNQSSVFPKSLLYISSDDKTITPRVH